MKTKLIYFLLFITMAIQAQEAIGFQVTQDAKLAFMKDDHGNDPFTPDMQFKLIMQGRNSNTGYLVVAPKYEYAQLYGGDYSRFGFEVGYSIHTYILKIDIAPLIGYGYAFRWNERYDNFEFSIETKLPITKDLSLIHLMNTNQRKELENQKWGFNMGVGLRFDVSTNYQAKQAEKGTRF